MWICARRENGSTLQLRLARLLSMLVLLLTASGSVLAAPIAFVQSNSTTPQSSQATVTVTYTAAQTLGNLNVVVVGWNDATATVGTVTDSRGNAYALAAVPVVQSGTASQAIYYAKNISAAAAGGNTVTVTFNVAAAFPDIRIAEYSGLDTVNPLDVSVGAQGTTTSTSNSGSVTTTNANDLLVGANLVQSASTAAGAGYTSRGITQDGDILEDRIVTVAGSYNATAALDKVQAWIMQMAAFRAAGGTGGTQPTAPTNLTATAAGPAQISLSWTASTEMGGTISLYLIERCTGANCINFVQVGTSASTNYSDSTGLVGSTVYNYRVRARDTANNTGPYSGTATATTAAPTFTAPSNLVSTATGSTQINLMWSAATETGGTLSQYLIERCTGASCSTFAQIGTSATLAYSDSTVVASTSYSYRVRATDALNNLGPYSNTASTTTPANSPTAPTNLTATASSPVQINLSWTASTETGGTISLYLIERCTGANCINFAQVGTSASTNYSDTTGLVGSTVYNYRARAQDTANNTGPYSGTATATSAAPTFTAPSNLAANANGPVQVNLIWTAGTETGGTITSYLVERCTGATCSNFAQIGNSPTTSYNDTTAGLTGSTIYNYRVRATDGTNFSSYSNTASATTAAPTFTAPSNLATSAVGSTQISLSWTAGGETGGTITQYLVERCTGANCGTFAQVGTSATTTYGDTGLSPSTSYSYRVRATDAASNLSPYSNVVSATTTAMATPITLIQHTSKDAGITNSSSLAFPSANTAGNWIAVLVRAGKAGQAITVSDSHGNAYKQALLFNMTVDSDTLALFYAENIAGGSNTVNVSDNIASGTMRFSIMEYSGVALTNSLDIATVAEGNSTAPNSGNAITAWGGDLVLGEVVTADPATFTPGTGYTVEDFVPAEPNTKLIGEDQIQPAAGTIFASATLAAADPWGAALAAFRSANGIPPQPITVTVSPNAASVGTGAGTQAFTAQVQNDVQGRGVTWALFGAGCSGGTCGALSQVTTTSVTYTAPTPVPSPATVTLTATSVTDNTKSGSAAITVVPGPLAVTILPKRGSITTSQTQQFTATVFNDPSNSGVTWQVDGSTGGNATTGTISTAGLFTPGTQPGLHMITATSVANASVSSTVSFAVSDLQGVYMYHNDPARTGQNLKEYALTPANVNSPTFAQLFSCPVDGYVYAEPLYVANLLVGGAMHNVVFIATEHDSVFAFDADSPSCTLLWKTSFLGTNVTTMSWQDTSPTTPTNDVFPEIGITSTPVIDPATNTIYVEAKTKETVGSGCSSNSPCFVHRLHALNITTGAEKFGGPVVITAPNFVSQAHFNRPSLLLANGTVYIAFGSHGDIPPWYGWLFGYSASTLAQKFVFPTSDATRNVSNGASIWDGGAGPAADAGGNVYASTGNGTYDGTKNFSESALKLSPSGALLDWFTPFNRSVLDANDVDLGSAGILILPDSVGSVAHPHLALATGKIAILYLLDQTNLGKFNSGSNLDVQEVIPVPPPNTTQFDGGNYGVPAYWNGNIYTTGQNFPLSQFTIANGVIATPQFAVSANTFPPRGAIPAVSANGSTNGIVWVLDLTAWQSTGNAILYAYDATNVSNVLFTSPSTGAGAAGPAVKFTVPTVANGKVYVGGQSLFTVFGLLPN